MQLNIKNMRFLIFNKKKKKNDIKLQSHTLTRKKIQQRSIFEYID